MNTYKLFRVYLNPTSWIRNHPSCETQDIILNNIMDNDVDIKVCESYLTVEAGDVELWTGNYPFAFGSVYIIKGEALYSKTLPSREVCERLVDFLMKKTGVDFRHDTKEIKKRMEREKLEKYIRNI